MESRGIRDLRGYETEETQEFPTENDDSSHNGDLLTKTSDLETEELDEALNVLKEFVDHVLEYPVILQAKPLQPGMPAKRASHTPPCTHHPGRRQY